MTLSKAQLCPLPTHNKQTLTQTHTITHGHNHSSFFFERIHWISRRPIIGLFSVVKMIYHVRPKLSSHLEEVRVTPDELSDRIPWNYYPYICCLCACRKIAMGISLYCSISYPTCKPSQCTGLHENRLANNRNAVGTLLRSEEIKRRLGWRLERIICGWLFNKLFIRQYNKANVIPLELSRSSSLFLAV